MATINAGAALQSQSADVLIPYRLFEDFSCNTLSAGAFKTYGLLALWKKHGQHGDWQNQTHLTKALNTNRRSVSRYLAELGDKGYLRRIHHVPKVKVEYLLFDKESSNNIAWSI